MKDRSTRPFAHALPRVPAMASGRRGTCLRQLRDNVTSSGCSDSTAPYVVALHELGLRCEKLHGIQSLNLEARGEAEVDALK